SRFAVFASSRDLFFWISVFRICFGFRVSSFGFWTRLVRSFSFRALRVIFALMSSWFRSLFKPAAPSKDALGDRGENMAARFLRNLGYKIIVRNFRCALGE